MKTISILDVSPESYKSFSCGKSELDEYLKRYAKGNHKKGISKTFVKIDKEKVAGYYSLSMGSIQASSVPESCKLPKYPIPVARIGRLAVDEHVKGTGLGKFLLIDAFSRILEASQLVAAYAIIVDAKDQEAKRFYKHYSFIEFQDKPLSLFIPLDTVKNLFS